MQTLQIKLSTIKDVQDFVRILSAYAGEADLSSGRYVVDAKSIMGIFSLDLQKPISLCLRDEQHSAGALIAQLKPYITE